MGSTSYLETYAYSENESSLVNVTCDSDTTAEFYYTYDSADNILTASNGTTNNSYTYGNTTWRDLLTAYNSQNIAYEGQTYNAETWEVTGTPASGNPISYYNGTRWTLDWNEGRNLISARTTVTVSDTQEADILVAYTYDANGLRTGKTVTVETYDIHVHEYIAKETVEPTCTTSGYTVYECECGDGYQADVTEATGHSGTVVRVVFSTCTDEGYTLYECHGGTIYKADYVKALGHDYVNARGVIGHRCIRCGDIIGIGIITPIRPTSPPIAGMSEGDSVDSQTEEVPAEESLEAETSLEDLLAEESLEEELSEEETEAGESTATEESTEAAGGESMEDTPTEESLPEESTEELSEEETGTEETRIEETTPEESETEEDVEEESLEEELTAAENDSESANTDIRTLVSTRTEHHDYIYAGGTLLRDVITTTVGENTTTQILDFRYDENGHPYELICTAGETTTSYYYITNLQGDVMHLVDGNGTAVASYTYDP